MSDRQLTSLLLAFAIALGIFVAYQARHVLLLIYVSSLLAVVIGPVIESTGQVPTGRRRPGRGFALFILIAIAFAAAGLVLVSLVPPMGIENEPVNWEGEFSG
jgi:predicted PurR-regulated permease PerM